MIEQFYLNQEWNLNRQYHSRPSGHGSNSNEGVLHILQSTRTGASPSNIVKCHIQDTHCVCVCGGGSYHLQRCNQRMPQQTGKQNLQMKVKIKK